MLHPLLRRFKVPYYNVFCLFAVVSFFCRQQQFVNRYMTVVVVAVVVKKTGEIYYIRIALCKGSVTSKAATISKLQSCHAGVTRYDPTPPQTKKQTQLCGGIIFIIWQLFFVDCCCF